MRLALCGGAPFSLSATPTIVDLRGTLPTNGEYGRRALADIKFVVFHHSGVAVDSTALSIADYHVGTLGWPGIGYGFLVHWDGRIEQVNDLEAMSYHVAGHNQETLGVSIPGNWEKTAPPVAALASARLLWRYLRSLLPGVELRGHYEVTLPDHVTACPGSLWPEWRKEIEAS